MSTQITLSKLITPTTEDGIPDQRHLASLKRILQEIGEDTAKNLLQFAEPTALLQRGAADDGLRLAIAIFNEAEYLEKNHRFDRAISTRGSQNDLGSKHNGCLSQLVSKGTMHTNWQLKLIG